MSIRALIFDIYNTLLEVGPAPTDAEARWQRLWQTQGRHKPPMSLADFDAKSGQLITAQNEAAKSRGIAFPEVFWPDIARKVLPELTRLTQNELDDFLFDHAQLERSVRLAPGAAGVLSRLVHEQLPLGLCSNCQLYTLRELSSALSQAGLSRHIFDPRLCFYSFEAGFSKPDPQVFKRLQGAVANAGIDVSECLMVGDRLENDILPAKAQGWQTWHLAPNTTEKPGGGWPELAEELFAGSSWPGGKRKA